MPPAIIAAGIAGVATVAGGAIAAGAAGKAAEAQTAASEAAIAEQRRQYETTRSDLAPWRQAGQEALGAYSGMITGDGPDTAAMYEGLRNYPGYQFALEEGRGAIEQSAAGRGTLQSGQTMKDLTRYGQGLATSNFENYMNRLQGLSNVGQQTAVQTGAFGQTAAGQIGRAQMAGGAARASGYQGQAAAWGGALEGLAGLGGQYVGGLNTSPPITPNPMSSEVLGGGVYS